jgi:hypothetical protein
MGQVAVAAVRDGGRLGCVATRNYIDDTTCHAPTAHPAVSMCARARERESHGVGSQLPQQVPAVAHR